MMASCSCGKSKTRAKCHDRTGLHKETRVVHRVPYEVRVNDSCWHLLTSHSDVTLVWFWSALEPAAKRFSFLSFGPRLAVVDPLTYQPSVLSQIFSLIRILWILYSIHTHIFTFYIRASFVTAHDLPCFREDILLEIFLNSEPVSTWFGIRTWSAVPLWEGLKSVSRSRSRSRSRRSRRSRRSSYSCSCSYGESLVCFHCVKLFFNLQKVVILSWQFHSEAFSCIPYLIASQWKPKSLRGMFGTTLQ